MRDLGMLEHQLVEILVIPGRLRDRGVRRVGGQQDDDALILLRRQLALRALPQEHNAAQDDRGEDERHRNRIQAAG
jgi:hypothetical protein